MIFTVALFNQKTGHKFPTGSVEDRIAWLNVEATDSKGKVYYLMSTKKDLREKNTQYQETILHTRIWVCLSASLISKASSAMGSRRKQDIQDALL